MNFNALPYIEPCSKVTCCIANNYQSKLTYLSNKLNLDFDTVLHYVLTSGLKNDNLEKFLSGDYE